MGFRGCRDSPTPLTSPRRRNPHCVMRPLRQGGCASGGTCAHSAHSAGARPGRASHRSLGCFQRGDPRLARRSVQNSLSYCEFDRGYGVCAGRGAGRAGPPYAICVARGGRDLLTPFAKPGTFLRRLRSAEQPYAICVTLSGAGPPYAIYVALSGAGPPLRRLRSAEPGTALRNLRSAEPTAPLRNLRSAEPPYAVCVALNPVRVYAIYVALNPARLYAVCVQRSGRGLVPPLA